METPPVDRLAYRVNDAARLVGISRARAYQLLRDGRLRAVKNGTRTLILADSLREYLESLPAYEPGGAA